MSFCLTAQRPISSGIVTDLHSIFYTLPIQRFSAHLPGGIHPLTNDLLAPVLTLAGMQGSTTNIGNGMLTNAFQQFNTDTANAKIVYSLYDERWDLSRQRGEYEEGYPMSWALSGYQLNRMKTALKRANDANLKKFGFLSD